MFFLLISLELVEFVYRIQTSKDHSFLLFNKQVFLFVKTKYFYYSFFNLNIEMFFLYLDRLLIGYKKYFVSLTIIASLVLISILGITGILGIGNNYITTILAVKVDGFLITGI
jgi:hypothetical protein